MKCQSLFSGNKKNIINLSHRVVNVNISTMLIEWYMLTYQPKMTETVNGM